MKATAALEPGNHGVPIDRFILEGPAVTHP